MSDLFRTAAIPAMSDAAIALTSAIESPAPSEKPLGAWAVTESLETSQPGSVAAKTDGAALEDVGRSPLRDAKLAQPAAGPKVVEPTPLASPKRHGANRTPSNRSSTNQDPGNMSSLGGLLNNKRAGQSVFTKEPTVDEAVRRAYSKLMVAAISMVCAFLLIEFSVLMQPILPVVIAVSVLVTVYLTAQFLTAFARVARIASMRHPVAGHANR